MMKITAVQIEPSKLHKLLVGHFNLDELRTLCFDLQLDFEELPPGGKSAVARELVEYCQRRRLQVELAEAVLENRPRISSNEFARDISFSNAPFKGMLAFEEADEEIFFGREELTAELVARVCQPPGGSNLREVSTNFLAIVGASGSGKSSVVRAGMIPQLRRQTKWPIHLITPTAHPLQALATSLTRDSESVTATATLMDDLHKEPRALRLYAARMLQNSPADRLLLVIDQFEELFTLCKDEAERTAFVENLVSAVAEDSQITILLTLRADFYAQCLKYEPLHRLLEQKQKIVPTMSSAELRAAIELPAPQANLTFDSGLVDILLRDVGAADNQTPEPGALPLLSHALLETWQRRDLAENRLTLAGYTEAGGVQGAIAKTAESTYQQLPADQQKIARNIFLRLTELGEGTQDTRRRAALAELLPQNNVHNSVEQVLKILADARLLITSEEGAEVAHEALIREWPTLKSWLDENRDDLRLHRQLTEAAQTWQAAQKDTSYLYRGGRLAQINESLQTTDAYLSQLEGDFLQASQQQQRDELVEANDRAEREANIAGRLRQYAIFLSVASILAAVGLVIAIIFAKDANQSATEAVESANIANTSEAQAVDAQIESERQRQGALAQSLAALSNIVLEQTNDTELATLMAIEAARINWNSDSNVAWLIDSSLRSYLSNEFFNNTFEGHGSIIWSVAFSPDGALLASGSDDGTIRLIDLENPGSQSVLLLGPEQWVQSLAFSPDGDTLASGIYDGTIQLWDLANLETEPIIIQGHESSVNSIVFSPGGEVLASGSSDQTIRLWNLKDLTTRPTILQGHESGISSVAFSPDGITLASGSYDQSVRLWNMLTLDSEPIVLSGHEFGVASVAFSPDGKMLASGSAGYQSGEQLIYLWDLNDIDVEPILLRGHESAVSSVAFSPNGTILASGSRDNSIRIWNLENLESTPIILFGHESDVWSVAFSPDGTTLASASGDLPPSDNTVRLWDLTRPIAEPLILSGARNWVTSVTFSPLGDVLASGHGDYAIRLWQYRDIESEPIRVQGGRANSVAFSPDGSSLASGSGDVLSMDKIVRLWDMNDLDEDPTTFLGHESNINTVAFSPDGRILASGSNDFTIRLWDLEKQEAEPIVLELNETNVLSLAFSPDGNILASGNGDETILLWELGDLGAEPTKLLGHQDSVQSVTFSPDGDILASGSADGTVRLWNMHELESEPIILRGHDDWVQAVVFSPDGQLLASGSDDKTVRLWDISQPESEPVVLRGHDGWVLTVAFSPDGSILASGGDDSTIRLWIFLEELVDIGCQKVRRNLSWDEWQRYLPGEPYRQTCPNLPPHPSVPAGELE